MPSHLDTPNPYAMPPILDAIVGYNLNSRHKAVIGKKMQARSSKHASPSLQYKQEKKQPVARHTTTPQVRCSAHQTLKVEQASRSRRHLQPTRSPLQGRQTQSNH
jgi:hypothetical protein